MCIGRNYVDHIKELSSATPKQPFFFLKPPSSILLPGAGPVLRPRGVIMHYEVELGLVMGKTIRDLHPEDTKGAMDAIEVYLLTLPRLGYILAIDMTARNVQEEAKKKGLPWSIAKGFDTFMPISNFIAKNRIPNPQNAHLWLSVNNEVKQSDNTELMLFRIPRQLSDISKVMTLDKGDIVLTGTPKGVGPVKTGDVMRAGIKVDGKDIEEADMEVEVADREGLYEFRET
ncbi:Fumarylacetoacetate hydrolase domain-containing protein [Pyrenophora teres f. maculata]|nr:Fumarylacetoacetate hydrolase domain-containing protein [Pyrenophora teres f. maculata]